MVDQLKENLRHLSAQTHQMQLLDNQLSQVGTELKQQLNPLELDKPLNTYEAKINEIHSLLETQRNKEQQNISQMQDCIKSLKERIEGLGDFTKLYELSKNVALDIRRMHVMTKQESLDKHLSIVRINVLMRELETFVCQMIKQEYSVRSEMKKLQAKQSKQAQQAAKDHKTKHSVEKTKKSNIDWNAMQEGSEGKDKEKVNLDEILEKQDDKEELVKSEPQLERHKPPELQILSNESQPDLESIQPQFEQDKQQHSSLNPYAQQFKKSEPFWQPAQATNPKSYQEAP